MTDRKAFSTLSRNTGDWHFKVKQFLESGVDFLPFVMWLDMQDQQESFGLYTE